MKIYCDRIQEDVDQDRCDLCNEGNWPVGCDSKVRLMLSLCNHQNIDGTCGNSKNPTPECHESICPLIDS